MIVSLLFLWQIALAAFATHLQRSTTAYPRLSYTKDARVIPRPVRQVRRLQLKPVDPIPSYSKLLFPGQLGGYKLRNYVGEGDFGSVYKGYNADAPSKTVAIKYFDHVSDVEQEADMLDAAGRLIDRGDNFVVMPFYRGISLTKAMQLELVEGIYQPWMVSKTTQSHHLLRIALLKANCAASLQELHKLGIMHCDAHLKNFIVNVEDLSCTVTDLGSAFKAQSFMQDQLDAEVSQFNYNFDQSLRVCSDRIQHWKSNGQSKKAILKMIRFGR